MKVLMLGVYDVQKYSRGRILWKGLKANNVAVDVVLNTGKGKYFTIAKRLLKKNYDVILVTGKLALLTAWLLKWWHRKPIVFDTFISDYDTLVIDRKLVKPNTLKAWLIKQGDIFGWKLPDISFIDTREHANMFHDLFGMPSGRMDVIYVGSDDDLFKCTPLPVGKTVNVYFHGTFIPLQGVDVIVRAAKLLETEKNITFTLVGKGQTYDDCRKLADELHVKNIVWDDTLGVDKLPAKMAKGTICLGIFGTTEKALRVIPHKAYDTIAACRPLITSDTNAHREVFTHGKDAWLVPPGNPEALAEAIRTLVKNAKLRETLAKNGHELLIKHYSNKEIGKALLMILKKA